MEEKNPNLNETNDAQAAPNTPNQAVQDPYTPQNHPYGSYDPYASHDPYADKQQANSPYGQDSYTMQMQADEAKRILAENKRLLAEAEKQRKAERKIAESQPVVPVGYGKWLGLEILTLIPLIGLIVLICFASGTRSNVNIRKWARARLTLRLIGIGLAIVLFALIWILGTNPFKMIRDIVEAFPYEIGLP